jgi:hypothetical protein
MPDELICPIHGPYDASYGSCPYDSQDSPKTLDPEAANQDAQPTILVAGKQQPKTPGLDPNSAALNRTRPSKHKGFLDVDDGEVANQDLLARDDMTMVEREQSESLEQSNLLGMLWIKEGARRGRTYEIKAGAIIGRNTGMVILNDPKVSNPHARLTVENNQFVLWDFGSSNGSFVNGVRIRKATPLKENDTLKIGDTLFVLKVLT